MAIPAYRMMRGAFAAGMATLTSQAAYARIRRLPEYPDQDPSAVFGPEDGRPLRVVALGDSSMTGPGLAGPGENWLHQVLLRFPERRVTLTCLAVGGSRARDVLRDQVPVALQWDHDIAFVSAGANDSLTGVPGEVIERNLSRITDRLLSRCGVVVLCGIGDTGTPPRIPFPLSAVATVRALAADRIHERVAASRHRVFKAPMWRTATPFRERDDIWTGDLFHPNAAGHAIWADAVEPTVRAAVEALDGALGLS